MKRTPRLKKYVELFNRHLSRYLAGGVSIKSVVYPVESDGAVFEFILNKENDSSEIVKETSATVSSVLSEIPQRMIGGNIEGVKFGGTNLYLEGNRILIIKGEDSPESWDGNAVKEDVKRVVSTSQGGG
jgi:hypothetical protein